MKKKFLLTYIIFLLLFLVSCGSKNQSKFKNRIITKEEYIKEYDDFDRLLNTIKKISLDERELESYEYEIQESLINDRTYLISIFIIDNDSCVLSSYLITYQYDYYHNFIKEEVFYLNQPPSAENKRITPLIINAKLIIERPENNGFMNTIESIINIEKFNGSSFDLYSDYSVSSFEISGKSKSYDKTDLILSGGEKIELTVIPGKYRITCVTPVENQNNYLNSDTDWNSNIYYIEISNSNINTIYVYPNSSEEGYIGEWEISERNY